MQNLHGGLGRELGMAGALAWIWGGAENLQAQTSEAIQAHQSQKYVFGPKTYGGEKSHAWF